MTELELDITNEDLNFKINNNSTFKKNKSFLNISLNSFFKFKTYTNKLSIYLEKINIQNEASKLIENNSFSVYLNLIENGYTPSNKDIKNFKQKVINTFYFQNGGNHINGYSENNIIYNVYEKNLKLSDDILLSLFFDNDFQNVFYHDLINKRAFNIKYSDGKNKLLNHSISFFENNKETILNQWLLSLKITTKKIKKKDFEDFNGHLLRKILNLIKEEYLPNMEPEEKNKFVKQVFNSESFKDLGFDQIFDDSYYDYLLKKTKSLYIENKIDNLIEKKQIEFASKTKIADLPNFSKDKLTEIENVYNSIINKNLDTIQQEEINILIDKRLPEILQKYLSIDIEYRKELKNLNGKSAEDLLNDSLGNIFDVLKEKNKNINEVNLIGLSASEKYTKKLKQ